MHLARGEVPADKFWLDENRIWCKKCNVIMPPIKEPAHSAKCAANVERRADPPQRHPVVGEADGPPPRLMEDTAQLPTLEEISRTRCQTMKAIPARLQDRWARQLGGLLSAAAFHNDVPHWTIALMFAKCTLYTAHRGGRKAKTNAERVIAALDRYDRKEYAEAWAVARGPGRKARAPTSSPNTMERRVAQCIAQTSDAEYSRALAGLQSEDLAAPTAATLEILRSKHPATGRAISTDAATPPHKDVTSSIVLTALRSFPRGSSAGNLGLRAEHVVSAVASTTACSVLDALTKVVNLLQAGRAPRAIAAVLAGAKLSAFEKKGAKPGTDARPIAAGEFLRRLVAKCLCSTHKETALGLFLGLQFGVAVPSGGERIIHRMRAALAQHDGDPDWVTLKVDLRNAFNAVSRARALELVHEHCPDMYAWVAWCYQEHTHLVFHDDVIMSAEGVQQGDPLGPLIFSLVVHELVLLIQGECPELDLHAWYLDDGVIAGPSAVVRRALSIIAQHGPERGLHLNLGKCELISCPGNAAPLDIFPEDIPARWNTAMPSIRVGSVGQKTPHKNNNNTHSRADGIRPCLPPHG